MKIIDKRLRLTEVLDEYKQEYRVADFIIRGVRGSSGLANMSDEALYNGIKNSMENYARPPIPTTITKVVQESKTIDTRISGDDWRNDIYYAAAHIRYLIDKEFGDCFSGMLTNEQMHTILARYNGHGKMSIKYADDAMKNLNLTIQGKGVLYFYEK